MVVVFDIRSSPPGALPEASLRDLIDQATRVDMDEIRRQVEEAEG